MTQRTKEPKNKRCRNCSCFIRRKYYISRTAGKPNRLEGYVKFMKRKFCSRKCANKYNGNAKRRLT